MMRSLTLWLRARRVRWLRRKADEMAASVPYGTARPIAIRYQQLASELRERADAVERGQVPAADVTGGRADE